MSEHTEITVDQIRAINARAMHVNEQDEELQAMRDEVKRLRERKDGAYLERNQVVAALAKCFPSGLARTAIDGWDEEWPGLPPYKGTWDGHSTEEKYQRLAAITPQAGKGGGA